MSGESPTENSQPSGTPDSPKMQAPEGVLAAPRRFPRLLQAIRMRFGGKTGDAGRALEQIAEENLDKTPESIERKVLGWDQPPSRQDVVDYLQGKFNYRLRSFCIEQGQWEIVTSELVNGLTDYFEKRAGELGRSEQNPLVIAEVGAGSGRLAFFIQKTLKERGLDQIIKYSASDSGSEPGKPKTMSDLKPVVEDFRHNTEYKDVLKEDNKPVDVVLAVWPDPKVNGVPGTEWTKDFRQAEVGEYILIGDPPVCGDLVDTWGITDRDTTGRVPAYITDTLGYQKIVPIDPLLAQIRLLGASDNPNEDSQATNSKIALFRKEQITQAA